MENPYWQYFCGEVTFQHELPCDFTTLGKWRKRIAAQGFEDLLKETIQTGLRTGAVRQEDFARVNIDTTVQEKSVTFPTDAKLLHRMRVKIVALARALGIELRHKRYEFGVKVGVVVTQQNPFVLSAKSLPGNPFDGSYLKGKSRSRSRDVATGSGNKNSLC